MKGARGWLLSRFVSGTDCTGGDVFLGVPAQGGPPEVALQEGNGAVYSRVTGETSCVCPLQYLRSDGLGNEQLSSWPSSWIRFHSLSLSNG